jgi:hypothetical protein
MSSDGVLGFITVVVIFAAIMIGREIEKIRLLIEGPTRRCRSCGRRFVTESPDYQTMCSKRGCQKSFKFLLEELRKAENGDDLVPTVEECRKKLGWDTKGWGTNLAVAGWSIAAVLHGLFDTFVIRSALWGVLIEGAAFFLLITYLLKARGLTAASQLGDGIFGPDPEPPLA